MKKGKALKKKAVAYALLAGLLIQLAAANSHAIARETFDYSDYAAVLTKYVDDHGMVDYAGLKEDRSRLDMFAKALATLDSAGSEQWSEKEEIAFWINAYNALTLEAIINHYPIKPSQFTSLFYPENSIRQIPGVWNKLEFQVMGLTMTLDEIEHQILRKKFNEPRIHMALVCAAMGCPPLRNEPYTGERLDAQLDDQARRFLGNPKKFRIDEANGLIHLSPIFKWFGNDFIKSEVKTDGQNDIQRAVTNFIRKHVDEKATRYLATGGYATDYLNYDWSLNEQKVK